MRLNRVAVVLIGTAVTFLVVVVYFRRVPCIYLNSSPNFLYVGSQPNDADTSELVKVRWDKISTLDTPKGSPMHDKWIVVTTISAPTSDVIKLASIPGWKLVVVADEKTPVAGWSGLTNAVFLSLEDQQDIARIGLEMFSIMPRNNYGRKSLGYLYAIWHGAQYIYETDDDNHPSVTGVNLGFHLQPAAKYKLFYTNASTINAYSYFGQSTIWPRGFPLDHIAKIPDLHVLECSSMRPLIQQGVVNGDPDVDAIFRLTRKDEGVKLDVQFDSTMQPILIPHTSMCPFNSQNTLFHRDAFWALFLPTTVNMRITDIWRGLWVQRLLGIIDGYLAFFGPNAYQERSAHNYLRDFKQEQQLYHDSGRMIEDLFQWTPKSGSFFDAYLDIIAMLYRNSYLQLDDVTLARAWLRDLIAVGYKPPPIKQTSSSCNLATIGVVTPNQKPSSYLRAGSKLILH